MSRRERVTERSFEKLIPQCVTAYRALVELEAEVGVLHNTAAKFAAELYALIGNPGVQGETGAQAKYNEAKLRYSRAKTAGNAVEKRANGMVADVISLLKPVYGHRWNSQWNGFGFRAGSLRRPDDPLMMLVQMQHHFEKHPERELPAYGVTASNLGAIADELKSSRATLQQAFSERNAAKQLRDAAFSRARKRMVELRKELSSLLPPADSRWLRFGLPRPADSTIPEKVSGIEVRPGGADELVVSWEPSAGADNYRVSIQAPGANIRPVEVAYTPATECVISLAGAPAEFSLLVTAINRSGETRPTRFARVRAIDNSPPLPVPDPVPSSSR